MTELQGPDSALQRVESDIRRAEGDIQRVEQQITQASDKIEQLGGPGDGSQVKYWVEEKKDLRRKEEQLRREKEQLREQQKLLFERRKEKAEKPAAGQEGGLLNVTDRELDIAHELFKPFLAERFPFSLHDSSLRDLLESELTTSVPVCCHNIFTFGGPLYPELFHSAPDVAAPVLHMTYVFGFEGEMSS